jgi:large subunit ribosomal protein L25
VDVDVSNMALFDVIRVSDLPHSDKIKFLNSEDATVAHVVAIREEVAPVAEVEAVVPVAGAPVEPEVAKKGKTDADAAKKPEGGAKK